MCHAYISNRILLANELINIRADDVLFIYSAYFNYTSTADNNHATYRTYFHS